MNATLLLNASYEPLRIISWKKALTLLFAGKVEVIDEYDQQGARLDQLVKAFQASRTLLPILVIVVRIGCSTRMK